MPSLTSSMARMNLPALLAATLALAGICAQPASAKGALPHADRLADKLAIIEKAQLYTLLHDGDGKGADAQRWAETIFTSDGTFQAHWPDGTLLVPGNPRGIIGRHNILRIFGVARPSATGEIVRHVLGTPVFDDITAREAHTRTMEQVLRGPVLAHAFSAGAPAAVQPPVEVYIFHDTWVKQADGQWRKSRMDAYCVLNCIPFTLPPEILEGSGSPPPPRGT